MELYRTVIETIDARSFSNLWYWLVLAGVWTAATNRVLGVPWDMVARARRDGGQAEDDLHDVLRVRVLRMVAVGDGPGPWLLALGSAGLTALAVLGFGYGLEFGQAAFLLLAPLGAVWLLALRTARQLAAGAAPGEALYVRLARHRLAVQAIAAAAIFATALLGMYRNVALGGF